MTDPRSAPARFVVNVEAFVWRDDGRYLMLVRGASEEIFPNTLTPPGGKVEAGDGPTDVLDAALRRELREEAGIEVTDATLVESHVFEAPVGGHVYPILDLVFWCRYTSGTPRAQDADEVAGLEWLTPAEIRADARAMEWTLASLERAEEVRQLVAPGGVRGIDGD